MRSSAGDIADRLRPPEQIDAQPSLLAGSKNQLSSIQTTDPAPLPIASNSENRRTRRICA